MPDRQAWLDVDVPEQATGRDAMEARLEPGQRVEIYRPITADPIALRGTAEDTY